MSARQEFKDMYFHFKKAFGVDSPGWDMIHRCYSPYMFCHENRLNLTSEYLTWKWIDLISRNMILFIIVALMIFLLNTKLLSNLVLI